MSFLGNDENQSMDLSKKFNTSHFLRIRTSLETGGQKRERNIKYLAKGIFFLTILCKQMTGKKVASARDNSYQSIEKQSKE